MVTLSMLAACGGEPVSMSSGGGGSGGDPGGTASSTSTGASRVGATLVGVVRDEAGEPLADAFLGLCADACWASASAADGRFTYEGVPAGDYHLDVRLDGTPGDADVQPTTGTISIAMTLAVDETLELPPLFVPDPGAATVLHAGIQNVTLGQLTVTVDPASWSMPFGIDTPYLAAVRVPEMQWPPNPVDGAEVMARWALNPYGTISGTAMPLTITNDFGLAPGATASVYTLNPSNGKLENETTATVSADGTTLEAATGISRVTWVVLAR